MSEKPTTRAQARARTNQRILEVGRNHLTQYGAAALSLRAVARDLDMVSSAVYRYVASRDDLLTLLVVDAYTELANQVDEAYRHAGDTREQIRCICIAFHDWAVSEPARYALLYGSPVPGYQAPADQTSEPGTRVVALLLRTLADAADRLIDQPAYADATPRADFASIRTEFGIALDDTQMHAGIGLWAGIVGLTSLEVFGQFGAEPPTDLRTLFLIQLDARLDQMGLATAVTRPLTGPQSPSTVP